MASQFTFGDSFLNAYIGAQQRAQQQKQYETEMAFKRQQADQAVKQFNQKFGFDVDRAKVNDEQWQQSNELATKNYGLNEKTTNANIENMEFDNKLQAEKFNWEKNNFGKPSPMQIIQMKEAYGYDWDGKDWVKMPEENATSSQGVVDILTNVAKGTPKEQFDAKNFVTEAIKKVRQQEYDNAPNKAILTWGRSPKDAAPESTVVANTIDPVFKEADDIVRNLEQLASKKRLTPEEQSLSQSLLQAYYAQYEDSAPVAGKDGEVLPNHGQLTKINQYLQNEGYDLPAFTDYQANLRARVSAIGQKLQRLNNYVDVNKGERYYK